MEKLLLTVSEAADVLSVSRSRVYELLDAEQLDSVKIGRSRRVALSFGAAHGGRSVGVMNSAGLTVMALTGSPGYVWTDEPPDRTAFTLMLLRAVADGHAGALNTTKVKTAAASVDRVSATGTTHRLRGLPAARPHPRPAKPGPQDRQSRVSAANPQDTSAESAPDCRTEGPTLRIGKAEPQPPTHQEGP
jgi:excisionase family DNA binding protein